MSSTKPTTSVKRGSGWSPVTALAALAALAAAGFAARDGVAAFARVMGAEALRAGETLPPGFERDQKLAAAQTELQNALSVNAADSAAWRALARVRLLQGVAPELGTASPVLLEAATDAADRAARLDPSDPGVKLVRAQIMVARNESAAEAAAYLEEAYSTPSADPIIRKQRIETAFALWGALAGRMRTIVLNDVCAMMRDDIGGVAQVHAMARARGDDLLDAALAGVMNRRACAPPVADRESSPPTQM